MDMEKFKKAIKCCLTDKNNCYDCPYLRDEFGECQRKLRENAISLLKKQEPASPTREQGKAYCWKCGQMLPRKADRKINYCSYCGQAVKWDG